MQMVRMSDAKTILVTGCTSGIGLEVSRFLWSKGYQLVLTARDEVKLRSVSEELNYSPYVTCDLSNNDGIPAIFEFCSTSNTMLDGMVHCAGYAYNRPIRMIRHADMDGQMQLHYFAFVELCKRFYKRRVSNDGSSIVALSSFASITKRGGSAAYVASKAALNAAVSVASKEFVRRSIRVNALLPAYVDTRMNDGLENLIDLDEKQPMGLIPPLSVAKAVEFLLSEDSRYITGALIPISAGMEGI